MHESSSRNISQSEAILQSLDQNLESDESVILVGEGVPDPKGIFGTTAGLKEKYGSKRVFDMPLSENGMTGICIGAALSGLKPVMVHQRVDFALLSLDQLINNAAKWYFMFGSQFNVPIVIRMIIGRGWGQGPQHSQSLQALFAHIPGLKVVMPVFPHESAALLTAAIQDKNPVIFLEHRWLHGLRGAVPRDIAPRPLDRAAVVREGQAITVLATSYMVIEALRAAELLSKKEVELEVINLISISHLDIDTVMASVKKTGRVIVADSGHINVGFSAEVSARIVEQGFEYLLAPPLRIGPPDHPASTSHYEMNDYYPTAKTIIEAAIELLPSIAEQFTGAELAEALTNLHHDIPSPTYTGPF
jgi:pyruvate/2-oxoglutarate/acetoin dehydrogenase E1 component